jgi:3-phosphoshikimate 1-carboxyvinyltransferase
MAMSFAPLALVYPGLEIEAPEVVNKSYPRFWNDLQSLGFRLNLQS